MAGYAIGLTGGTGSGKSTAEAAFMAAGVPVLDADVIARALVQPGEPALQEIIARFGTEVLDAAGQLDRPRMRERVFADAQAKAALEAILHPRIRAALAAQAQAAPGALVVAAIPLLAEGGGRDAYPWLDRILVITATPLLQRERLMRRDGIDAALADRMIAAQASPEARNAIADDILRNDESRQALAARIAVLHRFYLRLAAEKSGG